MFESSQTRIMQLWGDTDNSGHYYTANWDHGTITKRGPFPKTDLVWTFDLGGVAAGVTGDDAAVYAMRHDDATVHVLDKDSGLKLREITLTGGQTGSLYGGLACVAGSVGSKLYYGARTKVHRHDLATGASDASFDTTVAVFNSAFTGTLYCVSATGAAVQCHNLARRNDELPVPKLLPTPTFAGYELMNASRYGAGFMPGLSRGRGEFWYGEWPTGVVRRYGRDHDFLGTFSTGQTRVMQ